MPWEKVPGNDGRTKKFYQIFRHDIKAPFISSFRRAYQKGELSSSQRQAVIRLIENKDKDKRYIRDRRSMSLLNVDNKLLSKIFAERLIKCLPFILSPNQTVQVKCRFINEGGSLIIDYILRIL